jgi:hypothetical protein
MDIDDLKAPVESGSSIEEAAQFLCRADSIDDVARTCEELGLKPRTRPAGVNRRPHLSSSRRKKAVTGASGGGFR